MAGAAALVSGAARGIGRSIAIRLAAEGAAVCIADRDEEPAAELAEDLGRRGRTAIAVGLDVADRGSFERAAKTTADSFGDLTVLVNNAGIIRPGMAHWLSNEDWQQVHDVVLTGSFNGVRAVAPWFRDKERSRPRRIVNISSVAYHGGIGGANYSAAKAGLLGLTRAMAAEWAEFGVTVNAVAPGLIDVGLARQLPEQMRSALIDRIPVGRPGSPEDVAAAVAFFCSAESGFVTGQVLDVDGGLPNMAL